MFKKLVAIGITALALGGCGRAVEVPPAHAAKIMTKDGYRDGIIGTSKFRLDACVSYCDKLVTLDVSDKTTLEGMSIFIPKDKLVLDVEVQTTLSLNQSRVDSLFGTMAPQPDSNGSDSFIPWSTVYTTYAKQIILTQTREYLSQYSISEIASSMEKINSDLSVILSKTITEKTPFSVRAVGLTKVTYPKIITDAQEKAATRREMIQQEEAQLEISKVTLERQLQEARLNRQIDLEKAQGVAAAQKIQNETVTDKVLELYRLENQRLWIEQWSGQLPTTTMGDAIPMVNLGAK